MPGSTFISVFGEPENFEAALNRDGVVGMLITGRGQFRARLTRITLHGLSLAAAEEDLSRITSITVPADTVLVALPVGQRQSPVWGGIEMRAGEMMTFGPAERLYARSSGACTWGTIHLPAKDLVQYGGALTGAEFAVPPAAQWRPPPPAMRDLRHFFDAAIRMAETRPGTPTGIRAVHGLEQQMIDALFECLSAPPTNDETPAARRRREVAARFNDLLQAGPLSEMAKIREALGVSQRLLRESCEKHLGMSPSRYSRLRRMQQVRRALQSRNPARSTLSEIARLHGFRDLGRFSSNYRSSYGELPSDTLRRGSFLGMPELRLGRPRAKVPK